MDVPHGIWQRDEQKFPFGHRSYITMVLSINLLHSNVIAVINHHAAVKLELGCIRMEREAELRNTEHTMSQL
jgi:hypothetical protein